MQEAKQMAKGFIKKHGMDFESIDIEQCVQGFIQAMNTGLEGKKGPLEMIPTYISAEGDIPLEEPVIVMDAGGTNFRVAVVRFDREKKPVIEDFNRYPMPGTQGEVSKEEFFQTIVRYIQPVLDKSNKIGFCFSYPTEILPSKDGRLIRFCKEVQVKGMEGELVGAGLLEAIKKSGFNADKSIVLLNDTVATLLGGKAEYPDRVFDSYIGFILGTGTNTCYLEENRKIKKLPDISRTGGSMIINTESGAYTNVPRGSLDIEFDNTTVNPGQYSMEKMIAGGYQGGLVLTVLKKAAEEGLFSGDFKKNISGLETLASKDIDDFLYYPYGEASILARCCAGKDTEEGQKDRAVLYYLVDCIMERAAKLVTANLAAVILKTGKGSNPCAPVCVTAEGTTFYKSKLFRGKLDYYVKTYMNEKKGIYCEFVKADNATLIGTAIAGLGV